MENVTKSAEANKTEKTTTPCIFNEELKQNAKEEVLNNYIVEQKKNGVEFLTAKELFNMEETAYPFLIEDLVPESSISGIIAQSEAGKSTFLSQLALSVVKGEDFLGLKNNAKNKRVLWIATEENAVQISVRIKKQVDNENEALNNFEFAINTEDSLELIEKACDAKDYDLIVLDCYGDLNLSDTNSVSETRKFMNQYFRIAQKNNVAIIMIHHISKVASELKLNKNSTIGSTGFSDKIRHLIGLDHADKNDKSIVDLKILKSNLISPERKKNVRKLKFENLKFELVQENANTNASTQQATESEKERKVSKIIELKGQGLTNKEISEQLLEEGFTKGISESTVKRVIRDNKSNEAQENENQR